MSGRRPGCQNACWRREFPWSRGMREKKKSSILKSGEASLFEKKDDSPAKNETQGRLKEGQVNSGGAGTRNEQVKTRQRSSGTGPKPGKRCRPGTSDVDATAGTSTRGQSREIEEGSLLHHGCQSGVGCCSTARKPQNSRAKGPRA